MRYDDETINNICLINEQPVVSEDWDKTPTINDCSIKAESFFEELESLLTKNKDKMVLLLCITNE
jgi:hypothetical protein